MADPKTKPPQRSPLESQKKVPAYFLSILALFIIPGLTALKLLWKNVPKKSFFTTVAVISVIGWIWSTVVSAHNWWSFGDRYMLGIGIWPHLPLEEFLFYPCGGAFCLLIYIATCKKIVKTNAGFTWIFQVAGLGIFGGLAWSCRANGPYYLISQLVVYNLICGLFLAPWTAKQLNLVGLIPPILVLGVMGFCWDYIAFSYGWWSYHAITQIKVTVVPIDDFNYFFYAPTAAVSLYIVFCRAFNEPHVLKS